MEANYGSNVATLQMAAPQITSASMKRVEKFVGLYISLINKIQLNTQSQLNANTVLEIILNFTTFIFRCFLVYCVKINIEVRK